MRGREKFFLFAALAAICVRITLPFLKGQLLAGHDAWVYAPRVAEFHNSISQGILLPQWAPDLGSGYGQPLFVFTPPLLYYLSEFWGALGFNPVSALNLVETFVILSSTYVMFLLCRLLFGERAGWLGAAAHLSAPYFLVDLFVRHAIAESLAFVFLPLTLYGFARYARGGSNRVLLLAASSFGAILLSHNASALIITPFVLGFVTLQAFQFRSVTLWKRQVLAMLLAIGATAFFWAPCLAMGNAVHIERVSEGYFNYATHFVYPKQLVTNAWGYRFSIEGPDDMMSFSLGPVHVCFAVLALVLGMVQQRRGSGSPRSALFIQAFLAASAIVLCFLMTPYSRIVWDHLPLLGDIQFPWRLLLPATITVVLLASSLVSTLPRVSDRIPLITIAAAIVLIAPSWRHAKPEAYLGLDPLWWSTDDIARRGIETTVLGEFEPRGVRVRPAFGAEPLTAVQGTIHPGKYELTPESWSAEVVSDGAAVVEARLFSFPEWQVQIDGRDIPSDSNPVSGQIRFQITDRGSHTIRIQLRPPLRTILWRLFSLASVLASIGLVVLTKPPSQSQSWSQSHFGHPH